jgi:hypothetical protein
MSLQELSPTRNFLWMHLQEPEFFLGSQVMCFWGDLSCHIKTPTSIFYKEVYNQKWYQKGLLIALKESHEEYLQVSHKGYSALTWHHEYKPQEIPSSRWPQEKDAKWSAPTIAHHAYCTSRQLGTKADQRYDVPWDWLWDACLLARVRWGTTVKDFVARRPALLHRAKRKESTGTRSSAKSTWEIIQKLL